MPLPPGVIPTKAPVRRRRRAAVSSTPPPAALVLVAADYSAGEPLVLVFDRAVDIAGFDGGQVSVSDGGGEADATLAGTGGATLLDPVTVRVVLVPIGPPTTVFAELTATGATGIVAVDDGGTWVGVTGLELPFQ